MKKTALRLAHHHSTVYPIADPVNHLRSSGRQIALRWAKRSNMTGDVPDGD
jgi:hypothetical protein